jgi:large conductance mechanosensitive channel protein
MAGARARLPPVDGRMVTLAVALVIGGAVAKFVSAFVDDVVMPLWGWMLPGGDWRNLRHVLPDGNAIWIGTLFASFMDLVLVVLAAVLIGRAVMRRSARVAARRGEAPAPGLRRQAETQ